MDGQTFSCRKHVLSLSRNNSLMVYSKPRLLAVNILHSLLAQQGSLSSLLDKLDSEIPQEQLRLLQASCYGACRHFHQLAALIDRQLDKPLRKKDLDIYCLLIIGAYQLLFMRMPHYAVINECVDTCKPLKKPWAKNLVNAILRSIQREGTNILEELKHQPDIYFSHPDWIYERLKADWPIHYQDILTANNQRAPMSLRSNLSKISRRDYLLLLQAEHIEAAPGMLSPEAIILKEPVDISFLPGFKDGFVSIQDEASQLAVELLQVQPGQRVLDACAAPGGKTCAILEKAPSATLYAVDNDAQRLQRIDDNLQRIQAKAILYCQDILDQAQVWLEQQFSFDRILLDVPCSASGVIRRHPDIKLLRRPEDLEKLLVLQGEILRACWPLLKKGGLLLYSTCSVFKAENSAQLNRFLPDFPDAREQTLSIPGAQIEPHGLQLFPQQHSHDGFYYALLQKC
jgi:16S rRNA (cytosine967-C5)-methyltransferase